MSFGYYFSVIAGKGGSMGIAVIAWQLFIFFTIIVSSSKRGWVAAFWVIWTLVQVYTLPLSVLQFFTIILAYSLAKPKAG